MKKPRKGVFWRVTKEPHEGWWGDDEPNGPNSNNNVLYLAALEGARIRFFRHRGGKWKRYPVDAEKPFTLDLVQAKLDRVDVFKIVSEEDFMEFVSKHLGEFL